MAKFKTVEKDIKLPSKYIEAIEKRILKAIYEEVYRPILKAGSISKKKITNSKDPIEQALRSNKISYWQGKFVGKFDAKTSAALKEIGAQWDQATASFRLTLNEMPDQYAQMVKSTESFFIKKFASIDRQIEAIAQQKILQDFSVADLFDRSLFRISKDIDEALENITVAPQLTPEGRRQMAVQYDLDLRKYVQNFTEDQVGQLRAMVRENFDKGIRYEEMIEGIKDRFKVTESKARFLARQETNLAVSNFKEIRYRDAGSEEYMWKTVAGSPNHPVRPDHKRLDNTVQRWDNPPITNLKTGARNHAGEDYNCRCYARPIFRFN